jgi:hypothetical protein
VDWCNYGINGCVHRRSRRLISNAFLHTPLYRNWV